MSTIIVSGPIANKPFNGGNAWAVLSWVLGLRQLGADVHFLEQIGREGCVGAAGAVAPFSESVNLAYFREVMERLGLAARAALIYRDGAEVHGATMSELCDLAATADLLINISGHLELAPLVRRVRRRAYLDLDPGYTQFWHADGNAGARLDGHELYYTVGGNIGTPSCPIPSAGRAWRRTRPPATLPHWPVSPEGSTDRFTTVASWRGAYGPVAHRGGTFGLKAHEFRRFIELPGRAAQRFEVALSIHPGDRKDLESLDRHGWHVVDPRPATADPDAFRRYVQTSGAEFSVAQGIYVETNSGWFSDRTVRYLASGKPALVQDTGFSRTLPVGEGLVAFRTMAEAVDGAERIARDYAAHSRAARALAEEYFDSGRVLRELLADAGVGV